jgi:hypothetical protein
VPELFQIAANFLFEGIARVVCSDRQPHRYFSASTG